MHAFRIGKLFGIEIRVDWSWVFIFVLMTWNLASVFAAWHPGWPALEPMALGLVASLLFFGCIVLHELAHSLVATHFGLRVRSITLFLFGGVSNIEHEPPSARTEVLVAVVGPITSIVLGMGFLVAAALTTAISLGRAGTTWTGYAQLGPFETLVAWLGPVNLVIGVFNLLPAFPLDGGRVLRSILWRSSGDLRTSTRRVCALGQLFGGVFVVAGIAMTFGVHLPLFGTGLAGGMWLAFIGWFLHSAATQSYGRLALDEALAGHRVDELMRRSGATVTPELPLAVLVHDYLIGSDEHAMPVVRDGRLVGLVSLTDVRRVPPVAWAVTPVSRIMRTEGSLATATPEEPVAQALEELARQDVQQLPVLDHGQLVGMLQRRDIARWLQLTRRP